MTSELYNFILDSLRSSAKWADERGYGSARERHVRMYVEFKGHMKRYHAMVWLVGKLPVITFGVGLVLGLIGGRLL